MGFADASMEATPVSRPASTAPAEAVIDEVITLCRRLRLKYVREQLTDVTLTARAQRWDPAEAAPGVARSRDRRPGPLDHRDQATQGPLPRGQDLRELDREPLVDPAATQRALRSLEWVNGRRTSWWPARGHGQVPSARSHRPCGRRTGLVRGLVLRRGPRSSRPPPPSRRHSFEGFRRPRRR